MSGRLDMAVADLGPTQLKNIERPIRVYSLHVGIPAQAKPPGAKGRSRLAVLAAGIAAGIAILAGVAAAGWYGFVRSPSHSAGAHFPAIAVLPFDDLSPDKSLGYLGDGVSEDIIAMLSRFTDSSVTARNSSVVYKGKPVDIRQVGRDLNVDYALEGSVRKEADQIRITAQLIDAKNGEHVWAEHYDKAGNDLSALQDEATEKIVRAITGDLGVIKKAEYHDAWAKDTATLANTITIFAPTILSTPPLRKRRPTAPRGLPKRGWRNILIRICSRCSSRGLTSRCFGTVLAPILRPTYVRLGS